jgi:hypothetical protein
MAKGQRSLKFTINGKSIDDMTQEELEEFSNEYPALVDHRIVVSYKRIKAAWDAGLLVKSSINVDDTPEETTEQVAA